MLISKEDAERQLDVIDTFNATNFEIFILRQALVTVISLYKQIEVSQELIDKMMSDIAELTLELEFHIAKEEVMYKYDSTLRRLADA